MATRVHYTRRALMPIDQIKRREFITLLGGAAAGWPLAARAQQPAKTARIGYLAFRSPIPADDAFLKGLAELGWIEGQNIVIERRFAAGNVEQLKASAGELVRLNVDVIVAAASAPTKVAKEATASIPIVFANAGDPVGQGFVQSRPPLGGIGRARWWMSWTLIAAFHECHEAMLVWPCKDGERQWCTMS